MKCLSRFALILPILFVLVLTVSCSGNSAGDSDVTTSGNTNSAGDSILGVWQWVGAQNLVIDGTPTPLPFSAEEMRSEIEKGPVQLQLKFYRDGTAQLMVASHGDTQTMLGTYRLLADGSMIELGTIGDWFVGMIGPGSNGLGEGIYGLEVDTNRLILKVEARDDSSRNSMDYIFEKTEQLN